MCFLNNLFKIKEQLYLSIFSMVSHQHTLHQYKLHFFNNLFIHQFLKKILNISRVGQLLIPSFALFISALLKRAIVRSLAQSLFAKEQKSNCSFVPLLKRANEQLPFLSLLTKERQKER